VDAQAPRGGREEGFTLVELLIVLAVIAVLLAVALPSFLGYRTRAIDATAKANIRAAAAAAAVYATENTGRAGDADNNAATRGFQGMNTNRLRRYDRGIRTTITVYAARTTVSAYCLRTTHMGRSWSMLGPGIASSSYRRNTTCA
jgi:prepilin-type N-terminal cleavage/methylation domain-containing protein